VNKYKLKDLNFSNMHKKNSDSLNKDCRQDQTTDTTNGVMPQTIENHRLERCT